MPNLNWNQALTANQLGYNPLSGWQYETVPYQYARGAAVQILMQATDANTRVTVSSGSQTIQERSVIPGGGTAGTLPSIYAVNPITFMAQPGDRLKLAIDEVAGGTPTVMGSIVIEPV